MFTFFLCSTEAKPTNNSLKIENKKTYPKFYKPINREKKLTLELICFFLFYLFLEYYETVSLISKSLFIKSVFLQHGNEATL